MHHLRPLIWPSIGTQSFRLANIGINLSIMPLELWKNKLPNEKVLQRCEVTIFFSSLFRTSACGLRPCWALGWACHRRRCFLLLLLFFPIPCQTPDATVGKKKKELLRTYFFKWLLSDVFNPVALQRRCSHIWGGPARRSPQLITGLGCVCARRSLGGSVHAVLQPPVRNSVGGRAARQAGWNFQDLQYCWVRYEWESYHVKKKQPKNNQKVGLEKQSLSPKNEHKEKSRGVSGVLTLKVENQPVCLQQSRPLSAALQKPPKPQIEFKAATSRLSYHVSASVHANVFNCVSRRCRARTKPATV